MVVQLIRSQRDTGLYLTAVVLYNEYLDSIGSTEDRVTVDSAWEEATKARNEAERNKLEVELKTYQSNMIKESIRVRTYHRELH